MSGRTIRGLWLFTEERSRMPLWDLWQWVIGSKFYFNFLLFLVLLRTVCTETIEKALQRHRVLNMLYGRENTSFWQTVCKIQPSHYLSKETCRRHSEGASSGAFYVLPEKDTRGMLCCHTGWWWVSRMCSIFNTLLPHPNTFCCSAGILGKLLDLTKWFKHHFEDFSTLDLVNCRYWNPGLFLECL